MVVDNFFRIVDKYEKSCGKPSFITKILQNFYNLYIIFFQKSIQILKKKNFSKTIDKPCNYGV